MCLYAHVRVQVCECFSNERDEIYFVLCTLAKMFRLLQTLQLYEFMWGM